MGKQPELAVKDLRQALVSSSSPLCYVHLAEANLATKDRVGAAEAYRKFLDAAYSPDQLHPLERAAYQALVREMN